MSTYTCPAGHTSADADYCDTCGAPITASADRGAAPDAPDTSGASLAAGGSPGASTTEGKAGTAGEARVCPNCGGDSAASALFCEDCGYDFTTGAMPPPATPEAGGGAPDAAPDTAAPDGTAPDAAAPDAAAPDTAAPDTAAPDTAAPDAGGPDGTAPDGTAPDGTAPDGQASPATAAGAPDGVAAPDGDAAPDAESASAESGSAAPAAAGEAVAPDAGAVPPAAPTPEWVAELWVDPDWYRDQGADDPCPSPGPPVVLPLLERSLLIGRQSASRNIHPQIDCLTDFGVSRRHAQLTTDGQRWWVEDLRSANGTFVGSAGGPLPSSSIAPGLRHELAEDERLYLGAWTRIVIRRATADEQRAGATASAGA